MLTEAAMARAKASRDRFSFALCLATEAERSAMDMCWLSIEPLLSDEALCDRVSKEVLALLLPFMFSVAGAATVKDGKAALLISLGGPEEEEGIERSLCSFERSASGLLGGAPLRGVEVVRKMLREGCSSTSRSAKEAFTSHQLA